MMASTVLQTPPCDEYFPQRSRPKPPLNDVPIPEELKHDYGFAPLPKKFNTLVTLFNEMEKILQHVHGREQRKTFAELAANVEKNCKRKFTEKHLAQIVTVYPSAYALRWEKPKDRRAAQLGLWDLLVLPNLQDHKDLAPFIDSFLASTPSSMPTKTESEKTPGKITENEPQNWAIPTFNGQQTSPLKRTANLPLSPVKLISPLKSPRRNNHQDLIFRSPTKLKQTTIFCTPVLDTRPKMDANRVKWRKMIFRHFLVKRMREVHSQFLCDNKVTFDDKQSVHESFKEVMDNLVPDIPTDGAIPLRRKMNSSPARNLQSTDIRTFLENVKWKTPDRRDKTPERNPTPLVCKSEPQTPQNAGKTNPTMKFEPITPKTPLEERLKAKFAANDAARKAGLPDLQKRRTMLHRLENTILEVIRAHLNLEQRYTVGLSDQSLLQKMGREINSASLLEHLRLLCELVPSSEPKLCWLESIGNGSAKKAAGSISHYFKINRQRGPNWITEALDAVRRETAKLDAKMRTLHRSPSSCF